MADIATLGLAIDSRSAVQATKDLDNFAASGAKASASAEQLARQNAQMAQSSKIAAESTKDLSYAKEVQRQLDLEAAAAADKFMFKLQQEAAQIGKTRAEILEMKAAMHGVSDGAQPMIDQIKKSEETMHKMNFATVGARRELLVLAHEASQGQWQRFGGSLMVLGERVDAMSLLFSAAGISVLGVGAAVAGVTYLVIKGVSEIEHLNKILTYTGNYAGQTSSSISGIAHSLEHELLVSAPKAKEVLMELAATGKFTGGELEMAGKLAIKMSDLTGEATEDIVKDLARMKDGVIKYADEADAKYHFLDIAQRDHIKTLEDTGHQHEAMTALMRDWDSAADTNLQKVGYLTAAYKGWGLILGGVKEGLMNWGSDTFGAPDKVNVVANEQKKLKELLDTRKNIEKNPFGSLRSMTIEDEIRKQKSVLHDAIEAMNQEQIKAGQVQYQQLTQEAAKAAQKQLDIEIKKNKSEQEQWEEKSKKMRQWFAEVNAGYESVGKKAKYSDEEIQKAIDDAKPKQKSTAAVYNADVNAKVATVEGEISRLEDVYRNEKRVRDETYRAKLISDQEFFSQERSGIDSRLKNLEKSYEKERDILERSKSGASPVERINIGKQLVTVEDKVFKARQDAAAQLQILGIQEGVASTNRTKLRDATKNYSDALAEQLQFERESVANQVKAVGRGSVESALDSKLYNLEKQYQREKMKLLREKDNATDPEKKSEYDVELEALRKHYDAMAALTKTGSDQIKEAQGDWTNGAKQSLANYADYAGNVASQTASMFQDGFRNMEDAVTNFAMTGKLNFHNFAEGVISDLIRIYIRQQMVGMVGSLAGFFGGGSPVTGNVGGFSIPAPDLSNPLGGFTFSAKGNAFSGGSVTAFAKGGAFGNSIVDTPTMAPMAVFGEAGPEAIMPLKRGPDGSLGIRATGTKQQSTSGDGIAIHTQINIASDGTAKAESSSSGRAAESGKQIADMVNGLISKAMADQMRQGGLLWKMKNGQN